MPVARSLEARVVGLKVIMEEVYRSKQNKHKKIGNTPADQEMRKMVVALLRLQLGSLVHLHNLHHNSLVHFLVQQYSQTL